MKKTLSILLVVIMALLIALTGCNSESKNDSEIRIGYVGPLTGDQAPWGLPELNIGVCQECWHISFIYFCKPKRL